MYKPLNQPASQPTSNSCITIASQLYAGMCSAQGRHMTEILVLTNYLVVIMIIIIESCVPQEVGVFLLDECVWMDDHANITYKHI